MIKYDDKESIPELLWNNFAYNILYDEFFDVIGLSLTYPDVINNQLISVLSFDKLVEITKYISSQGISTYKYIGSSKFKKEIYFKEMFSLKNITFEIYGDDFEKFYFVISDIIKEWWVMQQVLDVETFQLPNFNEVFISKLGDIIKKIYSLIFSVKMEKSNIQRMFDVLKKNFEIISNMPTGFLHGNFHVPLVLKLLDKVVFHNFSGAMIGPVAYDLISLINANSFTSIPREHETVILSEFYDDTVLFLNNTQTKDQFFVSYKVLEVYKEIYNYFITIQDTPISEIKMNIKSFFERLRYKNSVITELDNLWEFFEELFNFEIKKVLL